jgi:hypothetical protein
MHLPSERDARDGLIINNTATKQEPQRLLLEMVWCVCRGRSIRDLNFEEPRDFSTEFLQIHGLEKAVRQGIAFRIPAFE